MCVVNDAFNPLTEVVLYGRGYTFANASAPAYNLAYPDIAEQQDGSSVVLVVRESPPGSGCNKTEFLKLGGCGISAHRIPPTMVAGLRAQLKGGDSNTGTDTTSTTSGGAAGAGTGVGSALPLVNRSLLFDLRCGASTPAPLWPNVNEAPGGITVEVWTSTNATATALTAPTTRTTGAGVPSGMLLDCRGQDGGGVVVSEGASGSMRISLVSSTSTVTVQSEPGLLSNASAAHGREQHHVAAVVDGGPQLVSFVADAKFADGGAAQVFGYTFFKAVGDLNQAGGHSNAGSGSGATCTVGTGAARVRVYGTHLLSSELIHNYRATKGAPTVSAHSHSPANVRAPPPPPPPPPSVLPKTGQSQCTTYALQHSGCTGAPLCGTLNVTFNSTHEHKTRRFAYDSGGRTIAKVSIGNVYTYMDAVTMCGRECSIEPACRGIVLADLAVNSGYDCFTVNDTSVSVGTGLIATSYTFAHNASCGYGCGATHGGSGDGLMFNVPDENEYR